MKKCLSLCVVCAMVLSLAACGSTPESSLEAEAGVADLARSMAETLTADISSVVVLDEESDAGLTHKHADFVICEDDELTIAQEFYSTDEVQTTALLDMLYDDMIDLVGYPVVNELRMILNSYSIQGLHRDLEFGEEYNGVTRKAMVLACYLLSVEYSELFDHEYMSADEAEPILQMIFENSVG